MQQIYLTKTLAKSLVHHLSRTAPPATPALRWYADVITIDEHSCIALTESESRYCMLFCDLSEQDILNFNHVFSERLWREACIVSQMNTPLNDENVDRLQSLATILLAEQHYEIQPDTAAASYFHEIKEDIDVFIRYQGQNFPTNGEEAFKMGLKINQIPKSKTDNDEYFQPLEQFQQFWLGLLDYTQTLVQPLTSNVVHVDFGRK